MVTHTHVVLLVQLAHVTEALVSSARSHTYLALWDAAGTALSCELPLVETGDAHTGCCTHWLTAAHAD